MSRYREGISSGNAPYVAAHVLTFSKALLDMEDESLVGIVQLVDGERDPRNLMLVFSILKAVMIEWNISKHVQVN